MTNAEARDLSRPGLARKAAIRQELHALLARSGVWDMGEVDKLLDLWAETAPKLVSDLRRGARQRLTARALLAAPRLIDANQRALAERWARTRPPDVRVDPVRGLAAECARILTDKCPKQKRTLKLHCHAAGLVDAYLTGRPGRNLERECKAVRASWRTVRETIVGIKPRPKLRRRRTPRRPRNL